MDAVYLDQSIARSIELYPIGEPVVFPPEGGSFSYGRGIYNFLGTTLTMDVSTMVELPNGMHFGPVRIIPDRGIVPYGSLEVNNVAENVPGGAPPGCYKDIA